MKNILFAIFLLSISACHKPTAEQPTQHIYAAGLAGDWGCFVCYEPNQTWYFDSTDCTAIQRVTSCDGYCYERVYHYSTVIDTLTLIDLAILKETKYITRFDRNDKYYEYGSRVHLYQIGAEVQPIQYLERIK